MTRTPYSALVENIIVVKSYLRSRITTRSALARRRSSAFPLEQLQVVRESLGRRERAGVANSLVAARIHEREARLMLLGHGLRPDAVPAPERAQLRAGAEHEVQPADRALLRQERAGALGRVPWRIHGDRDRRHVMAELVESAASGLRLDRARVLAGRVEEGDKHRLATEVAHRDRLAVLVSQLEIRSAQAGRHDGPLEAAAGGGDVTVTVLAAGGEHGRGQGEDREQEERDQHARIHVRGA